MALSDSVLENLEEAEASLRSALSFAARQERPVVCKALADTLERISGIKHCDQMIDKFEEYANDSDKSGPFPFFQ